jgi:hypothetical protein
MSKANLGRNACCLRKVVHNLIVEQSVCVDVFGFEGPFKIEAWGVLVLVLYPASLLQCSFNIAVATSNDKNFCVFVNSILLLPSSHISNVQEDFVLGYVALNKILESRIVLLASGFFGCVFIFILSL